jgi:serine/threonine protein kinase
MEVTTPPTPPFSWNCKRLHRPKLYDPNKSRGDRAKQREVRKKIEKILAEFKQLNLPPIDPALLGKLYTEAVTMKHGKSYKLKKGIALSHWNPGCKEEIKITHACTVVATRKEKRIFIDFDDVIARGNQSKITRTVYILIPKTGAIKVLEAARYSSLVTPTQEFKKARLVNRIQKTKACRNIPQIVPQEYWSLFLKKKGYKLNIFSLRYDTDLLSLLIKTRKEKIPISYANVMDILLPLTTGLKKLSTENRLIHKDLKPENILLNYRIEEENVLMLYDPRIHDLDYCTKIDNQAGVLKTCGSLPYVCPTIVYLSFHERYEFKTLKKLLNISNVEDVSSIVGSALDLWGLGCILYTCFYQRLPPPSRHMMRITEIQQENLETEMKTSMMRAVFVEYEKSLVEMDKKFKEKEPNFFLSVIAKLLRVDPRQRTSIEELLTLVEEHAKKIGMVISTI